MGEFQQINRRHFLKTCGLVSLGFLGLSKVAKASEFLDGDNFLYGYGDLQNDPKGLLKLPKQKMQPRGLHRI